MTEAGDWRQAIWNRWLVGYLTPKEPTDEKAYDPWASLPRTGPGSLEAVSNADTKSEAGSEATDSPEPLGSDDPQAGEPIGSHPIQVEGPESSYSGRHGARARLDTLLEQVDSLEGMLDSLGQRIQRGSSQDRLEARRMTDALDRIAELQERHTDALLSCTRALERLERRMIGLERNTLGRIEVREPLGTFHSEPPRTPEPELRETVAPSARYHPPHSGARFSADAAQAFQGNLGDLSIPTLLSMFELEQRTGSLRVETEDLCFAVQLELGKLVGVVQNGLAADVVDTLASVIDCRQGRFAFTPFEPANLGDASLSIGTALLRISQRNDELKRAT